MLILTSLLSFMRRMAYLFLLSLLLFGMRQLWAQELTRVIINNNYKGNISLQFYSGVPCLTQPLLEEWGVEKANIKQMNWTGSGCATPASLQAQNIQFWHRPEAGLLTLLLPENMINPQQNGISTSRWDNGINGLFTNYRLSASHNENRHFSEDNGDDVTLDLDNGANIGAWRIRYKNSLWRDRQGDHGSYSREATVYRSIESMRSQLTLGDGNTSNNMFDSVDYRGVALASDPAMFPDSWRPFSPWINGYARSNADVTIYQNGDLVYRIQVPPGPFTIRDFYPPSPDGNLDMVIQESDGTERSRTLPYSSMPNLVHHQNFSYEAVAAKYRPMRGYEIDKVPFLQASLAWGALEDFTLFGGVQHTSNRYTNLVTGIAHSLKSLGAVSADIGHARYRLGEKEVRGEVARARYSKAFFKSETSLSATMLLYPRGSQYRSLSEKLDRDTSLAWLDDDDTVMRRWRSEILLNQSLNEDASLSLGWNHTENRGNKTANSSLMLSHNATVRDVDFSLYASYEHSPWSPPETVVGVTLSVPMHIFEANSNLGLNSRMASRSQDSQGVSLSGTALKDYRLRYGVDAQHTVHGNDSLSTSLGYVANSGESNVSYYHSGGQRRIQADTSGSILLHKEGVTLGQTLGETAGLVHIKETPDVGVYNQFGSKTNQQGEVLVSYLTPWRVNRITVDSADLAEDQEMEQDTLEVVPTRGAIVKTTFAAPVHIKLIASDDDDD